MEEQFRQEEAEAKQARVVQRRLTSAAQKLLASEESRNEEDEAFDDQMALDKALAEIFQLTGINDVDEIIRDIEQTEEIQYGLFNSISELDSESTNNETKISELEQELQRVKRHGLNNDTQKLRDLDLMHDKQKEVEMKVQDTEQKYQAQFETWNNMKSRINAVHQELGLSM